MNRVTRRKIITTGTIAVSTGLAGCVDDIQGLVNDLSPGSDGPREVGETVERNDVAVKVEDYTTVQTTRTGSLDPDTVLLVVIHVKNIGDEVVEFPQYETDMPFVSSEIRAEYYGEDLSRDPMILTEDWDTDIGHLPAYASVSNPSHGPYPGDEARGAAPFVVPDDFDPSEVEVMVDIDGRTYTWVLE